MNSHFFADMALASFVSTFSLIFTTCRYCNEDEALRVIFAGIYSQIFLHQKELIFEDEPQYLKKSHHLGIILTLVVGEISTYLAKNSSQANSDTSISFLLSGVVLSIICISLAEYLRKNERQAENLSPQTQR